MSPVASEPKDRLTVPVPFPIEVFPIPVVFILSDEPDMPETPESDPELKVAVPSVKVLDVMDVNPVSVEFKLIVSVPRALSLVVMLLPPEIVRVWPWDMFDVPLFPADANKTPERSVVETVAEVERVPELALTYPVPIPEKVIVPEDDKPVAPDMAPAELTEKREL